MNTAKLLMATLGAWKKCFQENRTPPFMLIAFVGAPLSQIIYGMILMNAIKGASGTTEPSTLLALGLLGGLAMGASAGLQGKVGAIAADAMGETGKGFGIFVTPVSLYRRKWVQSFCSDRVLLYRSAIWRFISACSDLRK